MARDRTLKVTILGDASSAQRALQKIGATSKSLSQSMMATGRTMTTRFTLPIVVAGGLAVRALVEADKASAQTRAALESTGGAANVTAKHIEDLAGRMMHLAAVDDEEVQAAENVLLTFTKIRNEVGKSNKVFDQATLAVANISARMGQDLQSSAVQVGKALNDPVRGLTSLRRIGIQFTEQQEDQIKTLVESNDMLGAQKIILGELETEFGGSAKAAGDAAGPMQKLMLQLEELGEKIAEAILPFMKDLASWLGKLIDWFSNLSPGVQKFILILAGVVAAAGPVIGAIGAIGVALTFLSAHPIVLVVAAVVGLTILIVKNWGTIKSWTEKVFGAVGAFMSATWNMIARVVGNVVGFLIRIFGKFVDFFLDRFGIIVHMIKTVADKMAFALPGSVNRGVDSMVKAFDRFHDNVNNSFDGVASAAESWGNKTSRVFLNVRALINSVVDSVNDLARAVTQNLIPSSIGGSGGSGGTGGSSPSPPPGRRPLSLRGADALTGTHSVVVQFQAPVYGFPNFREAVVQAVREADRRP